jgi:hypothetical protein
MIRPREGEAPECVAAIVARELTVRMQKPYPNVPDFADFRDALRPFIHHAIATRCLTLAKKYGDTEEIAELEVEIERSRMGILRWEEGM